MKRLLAGNFALATLVASLAAGCGTTDDDAEDAASTAPSSSDASTTEAAPYSTKRFVVPLTVDPPSWLPPEPTLDEKRFLTWAGEGADVDRAVRFIAPIGIYDPADGGDRLSPVPRDYVTYLLGLEKYGGDISAPTTMEVGGHPATLVTAGTTTGLSGSLGCQERGLEPDDCYGLQDFLVLHIAVIEVEGVTMLAWARTAPDAAESEDDFAAFEDMLASLKFR